MSFANLYRCIDRVRFRCTASCIQVKSNSVPHPTSTYRWFKAQMMAHLSADTCKRIIEQIKIRWLHLWFLPSKHWKSPIKSIQEAKLSNHEYYTQQLHAYNDWMYVSGYNRAGHCAWEAMNLLLTSTKRVDRKWEGNTADRMYDLSLFMKCWFSEFK